MDKLLTYPSQTDKGVNTFLVDYDKNYLVKTAAAYHPTIAAYINSAKPIPGMTQVLLTALGAGEVWGANVNGDIFYEDQLAHDSDEYGFKTFQLYAKVFKHHNNKPDSPSFGKVLLSVYNPEYHRVELIVGIDKKDGVDIVAQIENNEMVVWSMGCKIPYDVCSICGNKAPNRKHYCAHLKYMLGQIDPETGKQVYAINIRPKFFDISYVLIPADKTAMTLKKVASKQGQGFFMGSAELAEKFSSSTKRSEIDKRIPGNEPPSSQDALTSVQAREAAKTILEVKRREQPIPPAVIDRLCSMGPMSEVLSTMTSCLIVPTPQEFQRIVIIHKGYGHDTADKLDRLGVTFDPMHHEPVTQSLREEVGLRPERIRTDMLEVLKPYLEGRSYSAPLVHKRMLSMVKEGSAPHQHYRYVDTSRQNEKSDSSVMPILGLGAALYAALALENKTKAISTLAKLMAKHPTIATGLTVGAIMGTKQVVDVMNRPVERGHFTHDASLYPDTFDLYDRLERTSTKPYLKFANELPSSVERLLVGMPMCFMTSYASQRLGFTNPSEEEQAIQKVAQDLSPLLSGPSRAPAALIGEGNGPNLRIPGGDLLKVAGISEEPPPHNSNSASISGYVSSEVGPLDREILSLGEKLTRLGR